MSINHFCESLFSRGKAGAGPREHANTAWEQGLAAAAAAVAAAAAAEI
jgi:hypothetical protein